jgi:cobalamin-dependent methionine synthase I
MKKPADKVLDKEFQKLKRFVSKRFPGAHTFGKRIGDNTYYTVIDGDGYAIVDPELMIPPATTVRQAWKDAKYCAWFTGMIRKSNNAFNEEKMFKKLAKEKGEIDD